MIDSGQEGMGKPGHVQGTTDSEQGGMGRCGHVQGMTDSEQGRLLGRGGHLQGTEEWEGVDMYKGRRNGKVWTCARDDRQ